MRLVDELRAATAEFHSAEATKKRQEVLLAEAYADATAKARKYAKVGISSTSFHLKGAALEIKDALKAKLEAAGPAVSISVASPDLVMLKIDWSEKL